MEMSGFARIPGSIPIAGDIGEIWPILATKVADALGIKLDLMSYKQSRPEGQKFREWTVRRIAPVNREKCLRPCDNSDQAQSDLTLRRTRVPPQPEDPESSPNSNT